jgi:NADH:ubiquinone oxidoreductase subunit F (NADH-binding)/(2Fe-2S) ferredoxin
VTATATRRFASVADLERERLGLRDRFRPAAKRIRICIGTGCAAKGSRRIYELFCQAVKEVDAGVEAVSCVGCHGFCERGPIVVVQPGDVFYQRVEEPDVAEIFRETVVGGRVVERLLYQDSATGAKARTAAEIPFYKAQQRIVLAQNGVIDPTSIDDYIAVGGYSALAKALTAMTPEQVLEEVERSGLRGRGGGGFPTGRKWRSCREAHGEPKYVICNGDEGDPGAFMDRSVMEGNPHAVLEGMLLGAYAIGSSQGYIYVRNEYPLAVEHLRGAIKQAREAGLLGEDILGSGFAFDIRINRGGGAFICGESTALMASLEGRAGEPRAKYVHTVEHGLWDKPTNLNNVETWANVPAIINRGGAWLASIGTEKSKGTKVFSLVGKITNTGLVEVPMGITLRQIIEGIGGGVKGGKAFKAVQTGGPSGGCIPGRFLDTPVDFDELTKLGSMMGSGGMIVMDEDTCMVNVARYFLNFLREESCGKCTPCREGLAQMLHILDHITHGEGKPGDVECLQHVAEILEGTALCALGKTAAHPVLSTIRHFRNEYDAHILEKRCPAKECRGLFRYRIDEKACKACGLCRKHCPVQAIKGEKKVPHVIDQEKCTLCGTCLEKCPFSAVLKV